MTTARAELPQGTVTFLFTDIEASTELVRKLGPEYGGVRSGHRSLLREAFETHGGHEIDTAGDGFFVVFARAGEAVAAAVAAQRALADAPVRVRMGLHSAEPYLHEDGYVGVGVHRAERICSAGHGGQILLSNATAGIVEDLGTDDFRLRDLGEHRLKDLARPQRLFQVVLDGLPSEFPPPRSLDATSEPGVVTLLVTDLTGWHRMLRDLGDVKAVGVVRAYHAVVTECVEAAGGRVAEAAGDSAIAVFEQPRDALRAALGVLTSLRDAAWPSLDEPPAVRMGVHSGWVSDRRRHSGLVALHALALTRQAEPSQVLVSHATEALLAGEPAEVTLRDLGPRELADLERPVHVFELAAE